MSFFVVVLIRRLWTFH